jgi:hypothetical protein
MLTHCRFNERLPMKRALGVKRLQPPQFWISKLTVDRDRYELIAIDQFFIKNMNHPAVRNQVRVAVIRGE